MGISLHDRGVKYRLPRSAHQQVRFGATGEKEKATRQEKRKKKHFAQKRKAVLSEILSEELCNQRFAARDLQKTLDGHDSSTRRRPQPSQHLCLPNAHLRRSIFVGLLFVTRSDNHSMISCPPPQPPGWERSLLCEDGGQGRKKSIEGLKRVIVRLKSETKYALSEVKSFREKVNRIAKADRHLIISHQLRYLLGIYREYPFPPPPLVRPPQQIFYPIRFFAPLQVVKYLWVFYPVHPAIFDELNIKYFLNSNREAPEEITALSLSIAAAISFGTHTPPKQQFYLIVEV